MKIKIDFTILCLTIISIVSLFTGYSEVGIILWVLFGIYKMSMVLLN